MDFLILPLATAGLKAQSVAVIRLIVERVNELVSLFRSISVHYGLIQSALEWPCVVQQTPPPLPAPLACFVRPSRVPFSFVSPPLSLFPGENAIRGMNLRGWNSLCTVSFSWRRQRMEVKK